MHFSKLTIMKFWLYLVEELMRTSTDHKLPNVWNNYLFSVLLVFLIILFFYPWLQSVGVCLGPRRSENMFNSFSGLQPLEGAKSAVSAIKLFDKSVSTALFAKSPSETLRRPDIEHML